MISGNYFYFFLNWSFALLQGAKVKSFPILKSYRSEFGNLIQHTHTHTHTHTQVIFRLTFYVFTNAVFKEDSIWNNVDMFETSSRGWKYEDVEQSSLEKVSSMKAGIFCVCVIACFGHGNVFCA